jgi:hypothetical protein
MWASRPHCRPYSPTARRERRNAVNTTKKLPHRKRAVRVRVYVTDEELDAIDAKATAAGMTRSGYLRAAVSGHRIRSAMDLEAVRVLSKINGDQGRLGGLLRMYLKDPDATGSVARALLDQIKSVQRDLADAARKVK